MWEHIPALNNLLLPLSQAWAQRMFKNPFILNQKSNRNVWSEITFIWKWRSVNNGICQVNDFFFAIVSEMFAWHSTWIYFSPSVVFTKVLLWEPAKVNFQLHVGLALLLFWGYLINIQGCICNPTEMKNHTWPLFNISGVALQLQGD